MRRLWSRLAHGQGSQLSAARLAGSLGVSGHTVRHYLDVLTDLYMVRQLPPWVGNSTKRLVKTPKIYVRDTGLVHRLANIPDHETLLGYYPTGAQAEIDLVLEGSDPSSR